jgi:hypothetical protein
MTTRCWYVDGSRPGISPDARIYLSGDVFQFRAADQPADNPVYPLAVYMDGVDTGFRFASGAAANTASNDGPCSENTDPPIPPVDPNSPCDCLNGGCVPKTLYKTPGKYPSLAACQAGCAKDSACLGECVSPEQLAALQQAADLVKSKLCG